MFILALCLGIFICILSSMFPGNSLARNMKIRRRWIKIASGILGLKVELEGELGKGVYLFASNHRSFSDPMVALRFIYAWPLAKAEVGKYPLVGFGAKITGVLFVQRESMKSRLSARSAMRQTFEANQSVLIYPEGTTTIEAQAQPFKRGSFEVAAKMDVPVVPVAIEYEDPKHHWANTALFSHYLLQFGRRYSRCKIAFGPALVSNDAEELKEYAETWVNQKMIAYRRAFDGDSSADLSKIR